MCPEGCWGRGTLRGERCAGGEPGNLASRWPCSPWWSPCLGALWYRCISAPRDDQSAPSTPAAAPATATITTPPVTTQPTPTSSHLGSNTIPTLTTAAPDAVIWSDQVRLPRSFAIDLDLDRPSVTDRSVGVSDLSNRMALGVTAVELYLHGGTRASSAPNTKPSVQECRDAVQTAALPGRFRAEAGDVLCLRTAPQDQGPPHLAAMRILSIERSSGTVESEITVWEEFP
jgi:hypothetical protein